jgi:hypothetical protein
MGFMPPKSSSNLGLLCFNFKSGLAMIACFSFKDAMG